MGTEADGISAANLRIALVCVLVVPTAATAIALTGPGTAVAAVLAAVLAVFLTALTTRWTGIAASLCLATSLMPLAAERVTGLTGLPCLVSVCASGKLPSGGSQTEAREFADTSSQNTHKKSKTAL